ncbi:S-(Hydroxymethyl)glutathione dehydrogenase [Heracleum sosnowskyi]|uniref:S-(Hydroxymethyl)glutathione dehydrogenase n=1 Tax=Heracleum sosnowskyi TaxID=360622 RepID=A0AAD8IZ14_9APIA|nr:S-(Hydroxymethyl)glutathione dehydrogenase [Heracleum sosnowskyi]
MEENKVGKPIRCRVAIARKAGEPLSIEEVIVAPPKSGEVRLRIICSSLCYSDVNFWKMKDPPAYFPRILGHECFGVVESVEDNVSEVTVGDTVIPVFIPDCGECRDCISSKSNYCSNFPFQAVPCMHRDRGSRFTDINGLTLHHFLHVSSFSEYTVVDIVHITIVDPNIPTNRACLLSCGVSTAIGLAVSEGSRLCGAKRIIGVDVNEDKYEIAKRFGVTDFVNSFACGDKPLSQVIMEMTDGGADYCFECVGMASLVHEAFACCRKEVELDKFVTHEVNFEDINKAFDLLIEGKSI